MTRFKNLPELTEHLARAVAAAVPGATLGWSNQSCSAYVSVEIGEDEDGGSAGVYKLRFSDHTDRYGADRTIRVDRVGEAIENDGDFVGIEVDTDELSDLIAAGVAAIVEAQAGAASAED